MPDTALPATDGSPFDLSAVPDYVLYIYPRTGGPNITLPADWDSIPGARGCTPQSCAFRDTLQSFQDRGFNLVGLSAQSPAEQAGFADREHIPYPLVSDAAHTLRQPLELPVFEAGGLVLYKRVTLVVRAHVIEKVFYPVFPPDRNASDVLRYLS